MWTSDEAEQHDAGHRHHDLLAEASGRTRGSMTSSPSRKRGFGSAAEGTRRPLNVSQRRRAPTIHRGGSLSSNRRSPRCSLCGVRSPDGRWAAQLLPLFLAHGCGGGGGVDGGGGGSSALTLLALRLDLPGDSRPPSAAARPAPRRSPRPSARTAAGRRRSRSGEPAATAGASSARLAQPIEADQGMDQLRVALRDRVKRRANGCTVSSTRRRSAARHIGLSSNASTSSRRCRICGSSRIASNTASDSSRPSRTRRRRWAAGGRSRPPRRLAADHRVGLGQ